MSKILNENYYCVKCEKIKEQHKTLNKILPDDFCNMLCKYDTCEKCRRKIEYFENALDKDESKISRILLHMIFHNSDVNTNIHNTCYKHIIKRSSHQHKKIMKHFLNIHNGTYHRVIYVDGGDGEVQEFITHRGGGYNHKDLIENILDDLYDLEKCRDNILEYNIKNTIFMFNGFRLRTEDIVKQIIFEIIDFWLVGRRDYYNITMEEIREYIEDVFNF